VRPWDTSAVDEDNHVAACTCDSYVALMRDGYPDTFGLLVVVPHNPRMVDSDPVQAPLGGVDDHDLLEDAGRQLLDHVEGVGEGWLVLADDHQ